MQLTHSSIGRRYTFRCVPTKEADTLVDDMRNDGWELHSWEGLAIEDSTYDGMPIMLAFTRPEEFTLVDVKPMLDRVERLHGEAFEENRTPPFTPHDRCFFDEGRLHAYAEVLHRLRELVGA